MKPLIKITATTFFIFTLLACSEKNQQSHLNLDEIDSDKNAAQFWQPAKVKIKKQSNKYQLYVNNKPYEIKGAGIGSSNEMYFKTLAQAGGNTFRTWNTDDIEKQLKYAEKYNLMMLVGLDIEKELHGFDYNNEKAVKAQFEKVTTIIDKYKNHPNILAWVAGNELNLLIEEDGSMGHVNPKVYQAVSDIIDYIHAVDQNHPVTYTFAGVEPSHIHTALKYTPQVDFISVQVYQDLQKMPELINAIKVDKPYMITEYGAVGHWEMPSTEWGREIEQPSGPKASGLAQRIKLGITQENSGLQIGSFVFLWGQKQERTPTWYGLFNKDGSATARVDEMTLYWAGEYPDNRAPLVKSITLNGLSAGDSVYLSTEDTYTAKIEVEDPNGDELQYKWVLQKEVDVRSQGGAFEQEPETLKLDIRANKGNEIQFKTPAEKGDYRLYAYVYDGRGKVGNANFPFYVK
ncbi:glycoside hydrolase family 2 TIM barrel-domain containing protein [Catenovulum sediminis]|uniref:Glycoside hydrolase family 2 TIM barrel-domain containing protein n=1 Tax=Catenovulum sediminis TaxID=1740262 RepID=A0ABV1RJE0_9ALTE